MQDQTVFFTPELASRTLPLVSRIVEDILSTGQELHRVLDQGGKMNEEDEEASRLARRLHELIEEIEDLGCSFKDWNFEIGLVDFPAVIDGEMVYLCWRSDEPSLTHYHGLNDGYHGRRPIPAHLLPQSAVLPA